MAQEDKLKIALDSLKEITINLFNDTSGTGYEYQGHRYISLKEIGRQLKFEDSSLKEFTRWCKKEQTINQYIDIMPVKNTYHVVDGNVIMEENLCYVMNIFIDRVNKQRVNIKPFHSIIEKMLSFQGDYIVQESFSGYLEKEKFIETFKIEQSNQKTIPEKLSSFDFTLLVATLKLYDSYPTEVHSIINEFECISKFSNQIMEAAFKNYITNK